MWQEQLRSALKTSSELEKFLDSNVPSVPYPLLIPLSLAEKIRRGGSDSPLWRQFIPHAEENSGEGLTDPIGDYRHGVGGQLVHRYKNRALFFPTTRCPVLCRYCFRKNELIQPDEMFTADYQQTEKYLREHSEIEEVIFSGGDPFVLSNSKMKESLKIFSKIPSVRYLRFHTRTPVILPDRFKDEGLIQFLGECAFRFRLVTIVVHLNHAEEVDDSVASVLKKLSSSPLRLTSQSVLLRGVNDSVESLKELFLKMASMGVTPYYLHHPDKVRGGMHFYVSRKRGQEIYAQLRRETAGQVLPHYVVERPEGEGKVLAM